MALFALGSGTSFANECAAPGPCLNIMEQYAKEKLAKKLDPEEITNANDYAIGINFARLCALKKEVSETALENKYTNSLQNPKSRWIHIIMKKRENDPRDPTIPCLKKINRCSADKPCLDKMEQYADEKLAKKLDPEKITDESDYAIGINFSRICAGKAPIEAYLLEKKYREKLSDQKTWADIINIKANKNAKDSVIPCLKEIRTCTADKPCLEKMSTIPQAIKNQKDYVAGASLAYLCAGLPPPPDSELAKEYKGQKTWSKIAQGRKPDDPIIPCLNAIKVCSSKSPCLDTMKNVDAEITTAADYAKGMETAFKDCIGGTNAPTKEVLIKGYAAIPGPKNTWADIVKTRKAGDPIIPCLNAIPEFCDKKRPCLYKMGRILPQIKTQEDYAKGMETAFKDCIGGANAPTAAQLKTAYNAIPGPKNTWADIVKTRKAGDPIIPCLKAIPPCTPDNPCLDKMKDVKEAIATEKDYATGWMMVLDCIGETKKPTPAELKRQYRAMIKGGKGSWRDIIAQLDPKDLTKKCIEAIPKK